MKSFFTLMILILTFQNLKATTYYVDLNQASSGSGTISSPFNNLFDALSITVSGDEILITVGLINYGSTIFINNKDLIIKGGYNSTFDTQTGYTTLDGQNEYRVLRTQGLTSGTLLDHLIISNGYTLENGGGLYNTSPITLSNIQFFSNKSLNSLGGGIYNTSSPGLTDVSFNQNVAIDGGGMYNANAANPTLTNVTFIENAAITGGNGGGMYNSAASSPILYNVNFIRNTADVRGGGMYNVNFNYTTTSAPILTNVVFSGNKAEWSGGGIWNSYSSPVLTNVVFIGNETAVYGTGGGGAGMNNYNNSSPVLTNVTFVGNKALASRGGAIHNEASSMTIYNSVFYGNEAAINSNLPDIYNASSTINPNSSNNASDVGTSSLLNLVDPNFIDISGFSAEELFIDINDPDGGDNVFGTTDDGIMLYPDPSSPLKNTGVNGVNTEPYDLAGQNRIFNTTIDIGAYETHCLGVVVYVDKDASGTGDGATWANAYTDLQTAIDNTCYITEIRIAAQTITLTATINVTSDHIIKGGYEIGTNNQTGHTTLDGGGSHQVFITQNLTPATLFDHLIIANARSFTFGGGMYNNSSSPTLTNVIFRENNAENGGGGMYNLSSSPNLTNVTFSNNTADYGAGIENISSSPILTNVTFSNNTANFGAGIANIDSSPILTNVLFIGNEAYSGVGIDNYNHSNAILTNVTFVGNTSTSGGIITNSSNSTPLLHNTVFYGNTLNVSTPVDVSNDDASSFVNVSSSNNASDVSGSELNISGSNYIALTANPFVNSSDPDGPDAIFGTADDGLIPAFNSPLKDMGINNVNTQTYDIAGQNRIAKAVIDIGAYETPCLTIVYVDKNAIGTGDGSTWANAYTDLQMAINNICIGSEIRMAAQTITLTTSISVTSDYSLKGGYAIGTNNQVGYTTLDGNGLYQVLITQNLTPTALFDHLIITNGYSSSSGGGMYNSNSSPTITNVIFKENIAVNDGGGMYNLSSSPVITNVIFNENIGVFGGGIENIASSSPILTNVLFVGNEAYSGAGIDNYDHSSPILTNITFFQNTATGFGVVANSANSTPEINNSVFYVNTLNSATPIDVYNDDASSFATVSSSNNASDVLSSVLNTVGSDFVALTEDPFVNSENPDGGDGYGDTNDGLIPVTGSLLINAGDKNKNSLAFDLAGQTRILDNEIEIGAYEYDNTTLTITPISDIDEGLIVYPNPTKSLVYVVTDDVLDAVIYNLVGNKIFETTISFTHNYIDLAKVPSGVYLITFESAEGFTYVKKVLKQ